MYSLHLMTTSSHNLINMSRQKYPLGLMTIGGRTQAHHLFFLQETRNPSHAPPILRKNWKPS
jgi:hypothetical protein